MQESVIISQIFGGVIGAEICHYLSDFGRSDWGRNLSLSLRFWEE